MSTAFLLKKLLAALILPPAGPLLLAALGLLLARRRPRLGRGLAWLGVAVLWLLSTAAVTRPLLRALLRALEDVPPLDLRRAGEAQAIVVLSGGRYFAAPEYGGDTVSGASLERLRYAAHVARKTGLPLLATGGAPWGGTPEARSMAEVLEGEFGVKVRWVEDRALDTRENALYSAALLREAGVTRVLLVTHASHMRRAQSEFAAAGLESIAAPMGYTTAGPFNPTELLPSAGGLLQARLALHELLGMAMERLR